MRNVDNKKTDCEYNFIFTEYRIKLIIYMKYANRESLSLFKNI